MPEQGTACEMGAKRQPFQHDLANGRAEVDASQNATITDFARPPEFQGAVEACSQDREPIQC